MHEFDSKRCDANPAHNARAFHQHSHSGLLIRESQLEWAPNELELVVMTEPFKASIPGDGVIDWIYPFAERPFNVKSLHAIDPDFDRSAVGLTLFAHAPLHLLNGVIMPDPTAESAWTRRDEPMHLVATDPNKNSAVRSRFQRRYEQSGIGLVSVLGSLLVLGVVAAFALSALISDNHALSVISPKTGASPNSQASARPNLVIDRSADEVAQSNLDAALDAADARSIQVGGYGAIAVQSLSKILPASALTTGPSTTASAISVASAGGVTGGVTFAARSLSGLCWLVWRSNSSTLFGIRRDHAACTALPLTNPPALGLHEGVTWQSSGFPST